MINITDKITIVGPCAMESKEQIQSVFELASSLGLSYIRTQVFKPRTRPESFQGLGDEGIKILNDFRSMYSKSDIKYVCEVCSPTHMDMIKETAQVIQIGARNMQNFELLKYVSQSFHSDKHEFILLKRGFSNTISEWLSSADYLIHGGVPKDKIILCERGSRAFTSPTTVSLDFICAFEGKKAGYKVIIDPSHGSKDKDYVLPLASGSLAMGFDGLMIEIHPKPEESVSDKAQAVSLTNFERWYKELS